MTRYYFIVLILLSLSAFSCADKKEVDVTGIDVEIDAKRFEQDFFAISLDSTRQSAENVHEKYPRFFDLYTHQIISIGDLNNAAFADYLSTFLTEYVVFRSFEEVMDTFPDFSEQNADLTRAFKHYKYYFPEKKVPTIYTFVSGFNHSIVTDEGLIGIGLDKYLGEDHPVYKQLGWFEYQTRKMKPEYITVDAISGWGITEYPFNDSIDNLISNMIYNGIIHYFTKKMLPEAPDNLIFGFTPQQMEFSRVNEESAWTYLVEQKLLFSTDRFTISKFTNEGPFTKDFSNESPARMANWIGYKIVEAYVERTGISLKDLLQSRNYMKILEASKYNP